MVRTATGMDIEGMETGMVMDIGGRWRRAWRRVGMDDGGHATVIHEGVDDDRYQRTMSTGMDEGVIERRRLRRILREQQAHGTWFTTTVTVQAATLSLLAYAHPTRPVHASLYPEMRATLAQHNYAHPIIPSPSIGAQHNYLDLEPRTTIQLQGNEIRPRVIHYADDTVLLFPRLSSLLYLLFYDAFSHHIYVFLFVSVNPATEMATQEEMTTQEEMATQDEIGTQEVMATQEEPAEYTL